MTNFLHKILFAIYVEINIKIIFQKLHNNKFKINVTNLYHIDLY